MHKKKPFNLRSMLYKLARILGDYEAIKKGRYPKRIVRKRVGAKMNSSLNRLFRGF